MKLKELESALSTLDTSFPSPNIKLEQYPTSAHLASRMLFAAQSSFEDVEGRRVLDLGCGTGILSVGASLLQAEAVLGVDVDAAAIARAADNAREMEADDVLDFLLADVVALAGEEGVLRRGARFDTVVMNPPFGTRSAGVDMAFVKSALAFADVVYSLHKSSTRDFFTRKATELGAQVEVLAELKFDVPKMYAFHKERSKDVMVDLIRFTRVGSEGGEGCGDDDDDDE